MSWGYIPRLVWNTVTERGSSCLKCYVWSSYSTSVSDYQPTKHIMFLEKRKSQSLIKLNSQLASSSDAMCQSGSLPCINTETLLFSSKIKVDGMRNCNPNFFNGRWMFDEDKDPLTERVETIIKISNRNKLIEQEQVKQMGVFQCILKFFGILFTILRLVIEFYQLK